MKALWTIAALGAALAAAPAAADEPAAPPPPAAAPAPAADEAAEWVADFDRAVERARKEGKDLLVDFTGSDWCGWCIRLHEEVFAHEAFLSSARREFVLVALDFPRAAEIKAKVPNPARNEELQGKYGVRGFPTVLLMNADGEVYGRTGYQPGGPEKYAAHLAELKAKGVPALKAAREILAAVAAAPDAEKGAARERAVAALDALEPGAATASLLAGPVKEAYDADPENAAGVRLRAASALVKSREADDAVLEGAAALDPENGKGLLEQVALARTERMRNLDDVKAAVALIDRVWAGGEPKVKDNARQLAIRAMALSAQHLKDPEKAKVYARKVRAGGYGEDEEKLKEFVDRILGPEGEGAK
jgi:thiol-disulfide isomerase/thioredoxin